MCAAYVTGNSQLVRGMGDTALCETLKAEFSFSVSQSWVWTGRIAYDFNKYWGADRLQKRSDTGLTAKERVLIIFYPPHFLTICFAAVWHKGRSP